MLTNIFETVAEAVSAAKRAGATRHIWHSPSNIFVFRRKRWLWRTRWQVANIICLPEKQWLLSPWQLADDFAVSPTVLDEL